MSLRELYNRLEILYEEQSNAAFEFTCSACEKLIPLLLRLNEIWPYFVDEDEIKHILFLNHMKKNIAIRYCGRFFNAMVIERQNEDNHNKRIRLLFICHGMDDDFAKQFADDMYFGEKAEDRKDGLIDIENVHEFLTLTRALSVYFEGTHLEKDYEAVKEKIIYDLIKYQKTQDQIIEEIDEGKIPVFDEIYNKYRFDSKSEKKYILLPDGISIRYRGLFHNCIIKDSYDISVGYLKTTWTSPEENYFQDMYTCRFDEGRYNDNSYTLIHECSLNCSWGGTHNVKLAIKALLDACGEKLEKGQLASASDRSVKNVCHGS